MIKVRNLTKKYGSETAVRDLSFTVEKGHICGFLGANGAGKSTTMNIITGCLAATAGSVSVGGYDVLEEPLKAKRCMGYLPEIPPLYPDMTVEEYLRFVARAKGIPRREIGAELERVCERTDIADVEARLIRNLSKGYKQRVGIAGALLGNPEIVILDEPTIGLDPVQIVGIRKLICSLRGEHTVLLSSHIISEVNAMCDSVVIISGGELVAADTPENLARLLSSSVRLELTVMAEESVIRKALSGVENIAYFDITPTDVHSEMSISLQCKGEYDLRRPVSLALQNAGCVILGMNISKVSLEDIFVELTAADGTGDLYASADPASPVPGIRIPGDAGENSGASSAANSGTDKGVGSGARSGENSGARSGENSGANSAANSGARSDANSGANSAASSGENSGAGEASD